TDTDVGKTVIAVGLLDAARRAGLRSIGLKPVAAGRDGERDGVPYNADALALLDAATVTLDYAAVNPILLKRPMAPHLAAEIEGVRIDASELAQHCRTAISRRVDIVVVEGAGGWLVPLNERESMADLVMELGMPVVLVVGMRLGCLNHALLTAADIRARGLVLAGWVANCIDPDMAGLQDNIDTLRARLDAPLVGRVRHLGRGDDAADDLDLALLLRHE
ncbi:MAG: dethiobiotin synthase, partial [Gammaproteobacteria bacterium]|nr:dethiobiotin synthase [Gammaproteobacteria bacterium]